MLVTHNYFWPTINGHVYYDKPLGSYWLVIFSTPFTGGLNEAATRLPSAIAGLLAVCDTHDSRATPLRRSHRDYSPASSSRPASASYSFRATQAPTSKRSPANSPHCCSSITTRIAAGGIWVVGLWLIMAATSLTKGLLGFALPLAGDWRLFMPARRLGTVLSGNFPRLSRRSNTIAHRAQSMVLQLVHCRRHRARLR